MSTDAFNLLDTANTKIGIKLDLFRCETINRRNEGYASSSLSFNIRKWFIMANISYGVNILPKTNNAYTLGNSDYKWNNIYTNLLNGANPSNFMDATTFKNAGLVDKTYTTVLNGEFSVTTATSSSHTIPYAKASITGLIYKDYTYRVTFNGTTYELPVFITFEYAQNNMKTYYYIGNITKGERDSFPPDWESIQRQ